MPASMVRRRHGRLVEDDVLGARLAVVVRAADHARRAVEVEDRRRRGDLPLDRQRAPGVVAGAGSPRHHEMIAL